MGTTAPLLSQHIFYRDSLLAAGFTHYPVTNGHVVADCHETTSLFSLAPLDFSRVIMTLRRISSTLNYSLQTSRCGLSCDGSSLVSLIPLHGLSEEWKPIMHEREEYHDTFPGFLTSKNGPRISDAALDQTQSRIAAVTGIERPFNNYFSSHMDNQNIFARIIRGEVPQWRVWEDCNHVAFLTPFGNTPGYTVLVPRKHLSSNIFQLEVRDFAGIARAAYTVAQHLKKAFDVERCGMFFEGYEIDYAHVKLVPVHDQGPSNGTLTTPIAEPAPFQVQYEGYLTTQLGPLATDLDAISRNAKNLQHLLASQDVSGIAGNG